MLTAGQFAQLPALNETPVKNDNNLLLCIIVIPLAIPQKNLVKMAIYKEKDSPNPSMPAKRSDREISMTGRRPTLSASHPQK